MKVLTTSTDAQIIKVIPRVFTDNVVLFLRDDSTNDEVSIVLPSSNIVGDYLEVSNVFNLKEGHFYDLKIYQVESYDNFKQRVINAGGVFEQNICLFNFLKAEELLNNSSLEVIYKDKIFCTNQTINQYTNDYYSVNKDEYVSKDGNNDYIVL